MLRGSAAERAGMNAGDEWLGVEVKGQSWRITKLDDVAFYAGSHTNLEALVARDGRLLRLPLQLPDTGTDTPSGKGRRPTGMSPAPADTFSMGISDAAALQRWLG